MKKTLLAAVSATMLLSGAAFAQSSETTNPVPGTSAGENSAVPAGAASTVTTNQDAPKADTSAAASSQSTQSQRG